MYRDTVKPWFETGDKPTQNQFWTLFDYLWFKDETINVDQVYNLATLLNLKVDQSAFDAYTGGELLNFVADGYYDLQPGYALEMYVILPSVDMNIQVGTTLGGDEITTVDTITGGEGDAYVAPLFANLVAKRIYFTGITAACTVTIFKRKVKLS